MNYGAKIKEQRELAGLKKKELAQKIKTSHQNITRWEENKTLPSIDFCVKLADFYGITIDELIGREPPKTPALISYTNSTHNGNNYIK